MKEAQMHLINKIFNNETIRTVWDRKEEKYYISVVDIIAVLSDSKNPQTYWRVMKKRLKDEGNETVTNCNGLKLKAQDGKYRMTDVCDIEVLLTDIGEVTTRELAKKQKPQGLKENKMVAKIGGEVAKNTRKDIEEKLGETVVTKQNFLDYEYIEENRQLESSKK